jgi:hypothetical protein
LKRIIEVLAATVLMVVLMAGPVVSPAFAIAYWKCDASKPNCDKEDNPWGYAGREPTWSPAKSGYTWGCGAQKIRNLLSGLTQ